MSSEKNYGIQSYTPPSRPDLGSRTASQFEKATISHVEHIGPINRNDPSALHDDTLVTGEAGERVSYVTLQAVRSTLANLGSFQLTVFVILLSFVAAVSGFCFGYDTGVISAALVSIKDDFGHILVDQEKEWISTATSCGALIG